jgi:hypothetical protein
MDQATGAGDEQKARARSVRPRAGQIEPGDSGSHG